MDNPTDKDGNAIITNESTAAAVGNLDIDLIGCKQFVKVTVTGGTAGVLALGDATDHPVGDVAVTAPKSQDGGGDT